MIDVVGIIFNNSGRVYYFSPNGLDLNVNTNVVVETDRGIQFAKVVAENKKIKKESVNLPLSVVIRKGTSDDFLNHKKNIEDGERAYKKCKQLIKNYGLEMNLIDASFTLDRKQLQFHYTANQRIDFRKLAKELASIYKTRIELRQIGVRDKAREVGGIGPCGRLLCCSRFLYYFDSVSINMAKNQNLSLNPAKINGACGRLLCCLNYENDEYNEARRGMPDVGDIVKVDEGKGRVVSLDVLNRKYAVEIEKNGIVKVELKQNK